MDSTYSILDGTTTPNNCETEPVHVPGCVLPHGVVLVLDAETLQPLQISESCLDVGFPEPSKVLEGSLDSLLASSEGKLSNLLRAETFSTNPEWAGTVTTPNGTQLDLHVHQFKDLLYLELEPVVRPTPRLETKLRQLLRSLDEISECNDFCKSLAAGVQDLTGLGRVMIYRFAHDWSGEIVAESVDENNQIRFLGMRFPAMDVPKPARDIYNNISVRFMPDARVTPSPITPLVNPKTGESLDMTYCGLRGASEMYTEYLGNMGIISAVTASLKRDGKLWGLVACHHHKPYFVSPQTRSAFELLSQVASIQLDRMLTKETEQLARERQLVCQQLTDLTIRDDYSEPMLFEKMESLFNCDGVAHYRRGRFTSKGVCPTPPEWETVHDERLERERLSIYSSDSVAEEHGLNWSVPIAGYLCLVLADDRSEYLIWFRKETLQEVRWGGDPDAKVIKTGKHGPRLHPRQSFDAYVQTVAGRSTPWTAQEKYLGEIFLEQRAERLRRRASELEALNRALAQANEELDAFATIASHDLKEPLRGLSNYAKFLIEDYAEILDADGKHMLDRMQYLAGRMEGLLNSLLEFSRLNQPPVRKVEKPLMELVEHSLGFLGARIKKSGAKIEVKEPLPRIYGYPQFIEEIITNLVSNALKYTRKPHPSIVISAWTEEDGRTTFSVKDDGIGIPEDKLDVIFELLVRLHHADDEEFGEGFGIGLTVVRKMVDRHNGELKVKTELGKGTEFLITI